METSDNDSNLNTIRGKNTPRKKGTLVRFSESELATVRRRAASCRKPVARYLRETALGVVPEVPRGTADAELIRQLSRIGNNLNQLVRTANDTGRVPDSEILRKVLDSIVHIMRRLR